MSSLRRELCPLVTTARRGATRPRIATLPLALRARSIRPSSSLPPVGSRTSTPPMPADQPREDYIGPTVYTLSYLSRILRLVVYSALGLGLAGLAGYESVHLYIEHVILRAPTISAEAAIEGWADEAVSWTGRENGGTDSRLGWKARHALRGAYICQEWGAGGTASSKSISKEGGGVNNMDRGLEMAEEYIDLAIRQARDRGVVFPGVGVRADPTALDLLLLKAGVLERISTPTSLRAAKGLYEDVLAAVESNEKSARSIRLLGKIGDVAQRSGDDGREYWMKGLQLAGVNVATAQSEPAQPVVKGWFGQSTPNLTTTIAHTVPTLSPPIQRAVITILISLEAALATSSSLAAASTTQDLALSLLPPPTSSPSSSSSLSLHDAWTTHRRALLLLHKASVAHAQSRSSTSLSQPSDAPNSPLSLSTSALSSAESTLLLPALTQYTSPDIRSAPCKQLKSDAVALVAEAAYTRGIMLEKSKDLEGAGECFERAVRVRDDIDKGTGEGTGREEGRYWRAWARVREKIKERGEVEGVGKA